MPAPPRPPSCLRRQPRLEGAETAPRANARARPCSERECSRRRTGPAAGITATASSAEFRMRCADHKGNAHYGNCGDAPYTMPWRIIYFIYVPSDGGRTSIRMGTRYEHFLNLFPVSNFRFVFRRVRVLRNETQESIGIRVSIVPLL